MLGSRGVLEEGVSSRPEHLHSVADDHMFVADSPVVSAVDDGIEAHLDIATALDIVIVTCIDPKVPIIMLLLPAVTAATPTMPITMDFLIFDSVNYITQIP